MRVTEQWLANYKAKQGKPALRKEADKNKVDAWKNYDPFYWAGSLLEKAWRLGQSGDIAKGLQLNLKSIGNSGRIEWEQMEQQMFLLYLQMFFPSVFSMTTAVPLGSLRPKGVGGSLKGEGVVLGYPDVLIDFPASGYHGLRIEMKRVSTEASLSDDQHKWLTALAAQGYAAAVCHGHAAAIRYLHAYLGNRDIFIKIPYLNYDIEDYCGIKFLEFFNGESNDRPSIKP